jgi:hypothetical protein
MLANLKPGQHISYVSICKSCKPTKVKTAITHIEIEGNFGRLWTICGPLMWQLLTFKYEVVTKNSQDIGTADSSLIELA